MFYQQGDILLKKIGTINGIQQNTDLLYKGENHHHRVKGDFAIYKDNDDMYLESKGCELFHEEHKSISIPSGYYKLDIVIEYDHFLEESRNVID